MKILHQGFDTLDFAIEAKIPLSLDKRLSEAKSMAEEIQSSTLIDYNGLSLYVVQHGARGGYAYECNTGPLGATFRFKKPNPRDTWGVFVSIGSLPLAINGLGWARHYVFDVLEKLGINASIDKAFINRVDYAVDVFDPDFQLDPNCFVMHSQTRRKSHGKIEDVQTSGRSGRTTSVTVGTNPGKQVIIYDKREEVMRKPDKCYWWDIWNRNLTKENLPPLDKAKRETSQVWRIELRAYKMHLRDHWHVKTFHDLDRVAAYIFEDLTEQVRYTTPTQDTNRSRWPDHPIWRAARDVVMDDLQEMLANMDGEHALGMLLREKRSMYVQQIASLCIAVAALDRTQPFEFPRFLDVLLEEVLTTCRNHKEPFTKRFEQRKAKFAKYWPLDGK